MSVEIDFQLLGKQLQGELLTDKTNRIIYSTDASSYREMPLAIVLPANKEDIRRTILFAAQNHTSVIPRGAGTSLAGQVVGNGIVVDISKYLDKIIELNVAERWVKVEPGVNLSELNLFLKPHGLQFGPETSTTNRCKLGGMLGNNSCGLRSLIYGSVREHILEVEGFLADGSEVLFAPLDKVGFEAKCTANPDALETKIYNHFKTILSDRALVEKIRDAYPEPEVTRRNMGYAVDFLMDSDPFTGNGIPFNLSKLLAGSEGTLAFTTAMKVNLIPLPPKVKCVVPAHFTSLEEALQANLVILRHRPNTIELMDDIIMDCTKENIAQRKNRFFIEGDPKAILMVEFAADTRGEIEAMHARMVADLNAEGLGYHFPLVFGDDNIKRVWELRTAGLGLLSNIPGDKKGVTVIEDTAIAPARLPAFIAEFKALLGTMGLKSVYYAHIATGELHLRPLLNLKDAGDQQRYAQLAGEVAALVKKHRGSLSGEHGDGRLRGSFIPFMYGEEIYQLFKDIKHTWDPRNVMNPGKITDVPPITDKLRYELTNRYPVIDTAFDFSSTHGYLRAVEQCNGSADCRKSSLIGGTMCPTFMATRDEDKSTRGRANMLREYLHHSDNLFHSREVYKVLDLCISCKGCKSECPSNVDMAKIKAEFLQHYYDKHGIPLRARLVAWLPRLGHIAMALRPITNFMLAQKWVKRMVGFHPDRKIPAYAQQSLIRWNKSKATTTAAKGKVYLFADEFTNLQEPGIGIKAILLLNRLGYEVIIPKHRESGRTFLSKGFVREARKVAIDNILLLKDLISEQTPLIGLEPSTILTFRDEYPELVPENLRRQAHAVAQNALLFEEFFVRESEKGNITPVQFTDVRREIKLHGHCQQKAVASTLPTRLMLAFPANYSVQEIKSGCCGMAGSFGYEKEHYTLSMQIGEMVLFPEVRQTAAEILVAAPGTSCRHHIKDGTGRVAVHPVEIMFEALL